MNADERLIGMLESLAGEIRSLKEAVTSSRPNYPDDMLTTKEVAEYRKVSEAEVLRWVTCGLEYYDIGKAWKFKRRSVDLFIERFLTRKHSKVLELKVRQV